MQKNEKIRVEITDLNNLGCGVGHLSGKESDGITVFVQGAVTGDTVDASVIKVNKHYLVARLNEIVKPSPYRTEEDLCSAPLGCGGCVYRHVTYEHELQKKQEYVQTAFRKAGLPDVTVEPVRTAGELSGYRNKGQYPVASGANGEPVAGFYAASTHRLVPAAECKLQPRIFSEILAFLCRNLAENRVTVYDETTGKGLVRHLYLRMAKSSGEVMVCFVLNGKSLPNEAKIVRSLTERFPQVVSVWINVNEKNTNVVLGDSYRLVGGKEAISDTLCGLKFQITPASFYQVNHDACELLYGLARERAELTGRECLVDLYCGIGTIGLSMAKQAKEVIGMEIVRDAVERAKENAKANGIENASFFCGDAGEPTGLLTRAAELHGDLTDSVVVIDPPRKGTTEELIRAISERKVPRVVYVSCNPDTLARDCAIFRAVGYEIGTVTPVDLFPRTGHVESVVLLRRIPTEICGTARHSDHA